jgi:hypothetical protein
MVCNPLGDMRIVHHGGLHYFSFHSLFSSSFILYKCIWLSFVCLFVCVFVSYHKPCYQNLSLYQVIKQTQKDLTISAYQEALEETNVCQNTANLNSDSNLERLMLKQFRCYSILEEHMHCLEYGSTI